MFQCPLLISFRYFKTESRLAVSFWCNLIPMYFFKVISFHLEMSYVIIQCLSTVTLVNICSDLVCLQSQWFSANILWKFKGNGVEEAPIFSKLQVFENIHEGFSFSLVTLKTQFCNNVRLQIFSLVESSCIEIRTLLDATLQKLLLQVSFLGFFVKYLDYFL